MRLLRAATLTVSDPPATAERYVQYFDYRIVEDIPVEEDLARSWGAPAMSGRRCITLAPASGAEVYLRFIAGRPVEGYLPLRTHGWAAVEICVADVMAVHERMQSSPFEVIGPPRAIPGLDAILPMQVKGPDGEIIYFTQIFSDLPLYDLPRAVALVDHLFILVLACSDLDASLAWFQSRVRLGFGRKLAIPYTMLAKSFGLPLSDLHTIVTATHERDVFLELDQYPSAALPRPVRAGELPPGIGIATLRHPELNLLSGPWITQLAQRSGVIYGGKRAGTLCAPDGTLVEIVGY